ncbi:MAG TPA: hypothetical protein VKZ79_16310 [Alphaproteobacteria bacterium]|nr:hypothetical protein [Alphaproteobacteria bacterium]
MSVITIRPAKTRTQPPPRLKVDRDCGPEGCEIDWLASQRHEADLDIGSFTDFAMEKGWGDGLPLVPPTETRVRTMLAANNRYPDEVIAIMPPMRSECTVEKIAINAVMAGAPPESLPLLIAAVEAICDNDFELYGVNTTTAPVFPAMFVNGPIRDKLQIPYKHGCFGGTATKAVAIGRALRLIMRNIAGQVPGVTSQTTFGSPGRISGILVGEWEERSPWAPLAERRGVKGNAVTVFGAMGTANVVDTTSQKPMEFLEMIGKSLAYPGTNCFSPAVPYGETFVALNPICAEIVGKEFKKVEDVQEILWRFASLPAETFEHLHRGQLEDEDRVRPDGRVYLVPEPKDVQVMVCGGTGGLHAAMVHSFGTSLTQTRAII